MYISRMNALQTWMDRNGETDATLARKVAVSRVQISRIRRAKSGVSVKTAKALEALTQIPAANFLLGEGAAQ